MNETSQEFKAGFNKAINMINVWVKHGTNMDELKGMLRVAKLVVDEMNSPQVNTRSELSE